MANALYGLARQAFLDGDIDWAANNIKVILVDTDSYTVSIDTHDYLTDVASAARVATSGNLASKTSTLGVADAANITFSSVSGAQCEALVIYQDTGTPANSRLIAYIDTASSGLPVTPNGGNISVQWSGGASKIFKL